MARMRLGVALLVPEPLAREIQGLRRACGDGSLDRVPPHLTLVPPVNVREGRLGEALQRLRAAADSVPSGSLELRLGPVTTFLPDSPTLYLAVGGDDDATRALERVRDAVFRPPLERPLTWSFVPHVTLADELPADRLRAATEVLRDYAAPVSFTGVHLLREEHADGSLRWAQIADYRFGPPFRVGTGGLELDLHVSDLLDPEARALVDETPLETGAGRHDAGPPEGRGWHPLVVTARRRDELVGVLTGWSDGARSRVGLVTVAQAHRGEGIARHLHARLVAEGGEDVARR